MLRTFDYISLFCPYWAEILLMGLWTLFAK